jgi:hypothetical protein
VLFASFHPNTFRANSTTHACIPKQIPKKGATMRLGARLRSADAAEDWVGRYLALYEGS